MPKVTVVIAVHNGEKHIATCVQSILAQTFRDFEVVVVNDGSSDRTLEALTALPSERTTLINSEVNRGVAAARNIGVQAASGEYIAILDADDVATAERLQEQVRYLASHPHIALVGSYFELQSELGSSKLVRRPSDHEQIYRAIFSSCPVANTTMMVRREAFLAVGGYPPEFSHGEDYRFIVNLIRKMYRVANIPKVLVLKRETRTGLTFRLTTWQHFSIGLSHRLFAATALEASPRQYLCAIVSSVGILMVRVFGLNREIMKRLVGLS